MSEQFMGEINESVIREPLHQEKSELKVAQLKVFTALEKRGAVELKMNVHGEIDYVVQNSFDMFRPSFKDVDGKDLKTILLSHAGSIYQNKDLGARNSRRTVYFLYKDVPVISRDEAEGLTQEEAKNKTKSMFFVPESDADATNPEYLIKHKSDHYLGLHEVGRANNWHKKYPNTLNDFNSDTTMLDVGVPHMIYVRGNGARDAGGNLWVDSKVGTIDSERQMISGGWFTKNFKSRGTQDMRWDNPRDFIMQYGQKWTHSNALVPEDIPEANWKKSDRVVSEDGAIYLGNRKFSVGTEFGGAKVEKFAGNQYMIYRNQDGSAVPYLFMTAQIKPEHLRDTSAYMVKDGDRLRVGVYVPRYAFETTSPDQLPSFTRFTNQGREKIDIALSLPDLLIFRSRLAPEALGFLSRLTIAEQISIMKVVDSHDQKALQFIEKYNYSGMKLVAYSFMNGEVDSRLFDYNGAQEVVDQVFSMSQEMEELTKNISQYLQTEDAYQSLLVERAEQAFVSRAQDFLIASIDASQAPVVDNQIAHLTHAIKQISAVLSKKSSFNLNEERGLSEDKQSIVSLTGKYELPNNEALSMTIRPREVGGSKDVGGQARISFSFKDAYGNRTNMRIDFDQYGVSLDIGSRGEALANIFASIGKSHHTQVQFDRAFQDPRVFERVARQLPGRLGWTKFILS